MDDARKSRLEFELGIYRKIASQKKGGFVLADKLERSNQVDDEELSGRMNTRFGVDMYDDIVEHKGLVYWIERLELDLYEDVVNFCVKGTSFSEQFVVGLVYHMKSNAVCYRSGDGMGYVIAINHGLYIFASLVCQAVMLESRALREDAALFLEWAKKVYSVAGVNEYNNILDVHAKSDSIDFSIDIGVVSSVVLRFVAFHEFGHIKMGHVDSIGMVYNSCSGEADYEEKSDDVVIEAEFMADVYAAECMIQNTSGPERLWNSILFVVSFFLALDCLESEIQRKLCKYHPSPRDRALRVISYVMSRGYPLRNEALLWCFSIFSEWKGAGDMDSFQLDLYTDDYDDVAALFGEDRLLEVEGVTVRLTGEPRSRGMTMEEVVVNLAVTVVGGLPVSLLANYLFSKFNNNGSGCFRRGDQLAMTEAELEVLLRKILQEELEKKNAGGAS